MPDIFKSLKGGLRSLNAAKRRRTLVQCDLLDDFADRLGVVQTRVKTNSALSVEDIAYLDAIQSLGTHLREHAHFASVVTEIRNACRHFEDQGSYPASAVDRLENTAAEYRAHAKIARMLAGEPKQSSGA